MLTLLEDKIDTPLGPLWVIADEQSRLRAVEWEEHSDRMEQLLAIHYRLEGFRRVGCENPGGLSDALRAWCITVRWRSGWDVRALPAP